MKRIFLIVLDSVGIGAEPDGVAKIKDGKTGHHRIQINDADGLAGLVINHDIV